MRSIRSLHGFLRLSLLSVLVIPIPGCRTVERVEENGTAAELQLSVDEVKAIRRLVDEADVQGERTAEKYKTFFQPGCIPFEEWKGE